MIRNRKYGTKPFFAHAPGRLEYVPLWEPMLQLSKSICANTSLPFDITVVTFNNGVRIGHNNKPMGLFEECLGKNRIAVSVLGGKIPEWKNSCKIELLAGFLANVKTKYVLVADSSDVFLINKLDRLKNTFEAFGCSAVFNAEKIMWPEVPERVVKFEQSIGKGLYLNAGLWMSRTEYAKSLLNACLSVNIQSDSEQLRYKLCFESQYPNMQVDYECRLFQGLNRTDHKEIDILKLF